MIWTLPSIMTSSFGSASASSLLTGLVSYWKLDESSGSATDSAGGGNTGTLNGTITQNVSGKINTAYQFDGSSGYLDCGTPSNLELTSHGTMSVWAYCTANSASYSIIISNDDWSNGLHGYSITLRPNGIPIIQLSDAASYQIVAGSTAITLSTWTHYVATWDSSNVILYINGSSDTNSSETVVPTANTTSFTIGRESSVANRYFTGSLDEIGIWNRALTSTEVSQLYNSGTGLSYPF